MAVGEVNVHVGALTCLTLEQSAGDPRRALALDPANPSVRVLLASLLLRREQNLEAVGVLEGGLEAAPESILLRSALVEARLAAGRTLAALDMAGEGATAGVLLRPSPSLALCVSLPFALCAGSVEDPDH